MHSLVKTSSLRRSSIQLLLSRTAVGSLVDYKAVNEPILTYKQGSTERQRLDEVIKEYDAKLPIEIPICIGDKEFKSERVSRQVVPYDHKRSAATFYNANEGQIKKAIDSCLAAHDKWERTPFEERAKIFLKAADLISKEMRPHVVATTIIGQAKTIYQAEIDAAAELADFLRFNVQFAADFHKYKPLDTVDATNNMQYRGMEGFWAAVTPFNFTAIGGNLPSAPAIMGNVVVWKPTGSALLSNYTIYKIYREAGLPPGVINFVPTDGSTFGDVITNHPDLAGINFTGSVPTFRSICRQVGKNIDKYNGFPRLIGECGGKNFHFVHSSADLDQVAVCSIRAAFEYGGQKCSALSRLYVPQSKWPAVRSKLIELHKQLKVDSPLVPDCFFSAVIDAPAFKRISSYLEHARSSPHLSIVAGGEADDSKGYFIQPTIVETKDPEDRIMQEEIFGPIVAVYVYPDGEELQTLDLVDSTTTFALTGSVFAEDDNFLHLAMGRLKHSAGNLYINHHSTGAVVAQQPFGGARLSGTNDKAGGPHYLLRFTSPQVIKTALKPVSSWRQAHMHP